MPCLDQQYPRGASFGEKQILTQNQHYYPGKVTHHFPEAKPELEDHRWPVGLLQSSAPLQKCQLEVTNAQDRPSVRFESSQNIQ